MNYFLIDQIIEDAMNMFNFLKGHKSYIVGALMILLGLLQENPELILQGVAVMTLRAGISKVK